MAEVTETKSGELKRSLGLPGVLGQSIASVAPTATPTVNVALVFVAVGSGSWLAFLFAMVAILLVAANMVPLARESAAAGSLSEFVGRGLGETWRIVTGWLLLFAYLTTSVAVLGACVGFLTTLLTGVGVHLPGWLLVAAVGGLASVLALRNIRISTGVMLGIEILSVVLVLLLCLAVLHKQGLRVDVSQFHWAGVSRSGMSNALLMGILSFAGFEAAAALGDEAKEPLKMIPRALIATPLLTGCFFVFTSYVLVLGFTRYGVDVAATPVPLDVLAARMHRADLGIVISIGAVCSLFGCTLAALVATSRIAFSLARMGALPARLARVNARRFIPQNAVLVAVVLVLATTVGFALRTNPANLYDWFGTASTFGYIAAYLLTCVTTPVVLWRRGALHAGHVAVSLAAIGVLGYVLYASVIPAPAAPLNVLPWMFLVFIGMGTIWSLGLRRRAS